MIIKSAKFTAYMGKNEGITITDSYDNVLSVPFAEDNTDYQEYLKWVEEGNTADPAD
jgi:hypothetical protein